MNKHIINRFNIISISINISIITLESIKISEPIKRSDPMNNSEPIKLSEIDVKEDTINHYKPEKTNIAFNDKYIEYKSKDDENTSTEQYLE